MSNSSLIAGAAAPVVGIIREIKPDQLDAPTPCSEYTVRDLVAHLLFWGPSLEGAARKEAVSPLSAEPAVDLVQDDWAAGLEAQVNRLVTAWSEPVAWEGTTVMGGPTELPASVAGGMVFGELVVHGWDLARATGQRPRWTDEVLEATYQATVGMVEEGRQMAIYGPAVPVPASASTLDRMLGLVGRDPQWTP